MAHVRFKFTGTAPLLMCNERLANPLDPMARDISKVAKKRNKTESDYELLAKLEFAGGIYHREDTGPFAPATWIDKSLENSAKREKLGTVFRSYCRCVEDILPIQYEGPRTIDALWSKKFYDQRCVGIQARKTLRTRPCFQEWDLECTILYDEAALEEEQVIRAAERAGYAVGIGDYRPRFGRFSVQVLAR